MQAHDDVVIQILAEAAQHGRRLRLKQSCSSEIAPATIPEGNQCVQIDDMLTVESTTVSQAQGGD
jgi:hypothetical protein